MQDVKVHRKKFCRGRRQKKNVFFGNSDVKKHLSNFAIFVLRLKNQFSMQFFFRRKKGLRAGKKRKQKKRGKIEINCVLVASWIQFLAVHSNYTTKFFGCVRFKLKETRVERKIASNSKKKNKSARQRRSNTGNKKYQGHLIILRQPILRPHSCECLSVLACPFSAHSLIS